MNFVESMVTKLEILKNRIVIVMNPLTDKDINWRPHKDGNSIAILILLMNEIVRYRLESIFFELLDERDIDKEINKSIVLTKSEVSTISEHSINTLIHLIQALSQEDFLRQPYLKNLPTQSAIINTNETTILDICLQIFTNLTEYGGQIFYLANMRLASQ